MSLQVLMTPDCQVICVGEDGQFYSRSLNSEGPIEGLVGLVQQGVHWYLRSVSQPVRWYDPVSKKMVSLLPAQGVAFDVRGVKLNLLRANGHYLSVDWSGHIRFDAKEPSAAAVLRFMALDELVLLREMLAKRWVCGPSGEHVRIEIEKSTVEELFIGDIKVSFEQFIEAARQSQHHGDLLLNEEWKVWRFTDYNPLIVIEAFGASSLEELPIALESLESLGQYHGEVMVTSNQPEGKVRAGFPPNHDSKTIRVVSVEDEDRFAALRTRARLMADPDMLADYTPLLFVEAGVVFDRNIESFLGRCALARYVSAKGYCYHPEFSTEPQERNVIAGLKEGQLSGLMVVPHVTLHRPYLEKAFDLLSLCIKEYGENVIPREAQSILNYGLRQVGDFSPSLVETLLHHECDEELNPFHANGLSGFLADDERHERMERYYKNVKELWGAGM